MSRCAFLRFSSVFLFSLLTACDLLIPVSETPPSRAVTQAPSATSIPFTQTPRPTRPPATVTQPPQPTPTTAIDLEVIAPENADRLSLGMQFDTGSALDFAWLPEDHGLVLNTTEQALTTSEHEFAPSAFLEVSSITQFLLAPDGQQYAAIQSNRQVMLGDLTRGITQTLAALPGSVTSLAFSPDSTRLAVASSDANQIVIWDTRGGVILANYTLPYWLEDLAISADNRLLAGADVTQFSLLFLDPATGAVLRSLQWTESASPALYGAVLSPDWSQVAWYARGTVQLMDAASGASGPALEHEDFISDVAWSPDSRIIASAAAATIAEEFLPVVLLWDAFSGEQLAVLALKNPVTQLKFNPAGTQLGILTSDGGFQSWIVQP